MPWFLKLANNTLSQEQHGIDLHKGDHRITILNSTYVTGIGLLDAVSRIVQ